MNELDIKFQIPVEKKISNITLKATLHITFQSKETSTKDMIKIELKEISIKVPLMRQLKQEDYTFTLFLEKGDLLSENFSNLIYNDELYVDTQNYHRRNLSRLPRQFIQNTSQRRMYIKENYSLSQNRQQRKPRYSLQRIIQNETTKTIRVHVWDNLKNLFVVKFDIDYSKKFILCKGVDIEKLLNIPGLSYQMKVELNIPEDKFREAYNKVIKSKINSTFQDKTQSQKNNIQSQNKDIILFYPQQKLKRKYQQHQLQNQKFQTSTINQFIRNNL